MDKTPVQVPFGYKPEEETTKGTLFIYDSFEMQIAEETGGLIDSLTAADLKALTAWAERRMITRIVFYIPHEESLKRMGFSHPHPLHQREAHLREVTDGLDIAVPMEINTWERRRKKYTPIDTALRYMSESFPAPYFIGMSGTFANRFASYKGFEEWIRRVRLIIRAPETFEPHPLLQKFENRWGLAAESD